MTPKCPDCKHDQDDCSCSETIESLRQQLNDLLAAFDNLATVKGRYHTEFAWRQMADLVAKIKAAWEPK